MEEICNSKCSILQGTVGFKVRSSGFSFSQQCSGGLSNAPCFLHIFLFY